MFKIESYVTPILLSYVDKYVKDFKPADAQVSLWGGGVALHNLVLKADVLQQEVSLPFTLVSGRIHELLIQVPWTKIMSEPIVVTIDTIECVLSLRPHRTSVDESSAPDTPTRKSQVVEAPPGYMQALVRRIVSNISLRVHHLIVKFVHDDIVLSLNVKHVAIDSAGENWTPYFSDIDPACPVVRRLVRLDDLTLCLDRTDADGKIRFYQEPLLYRCRLELRVQTRLVSATTRRAASLSLQLRSGKLAWGVTDEQLLLLLRLATEQPTGAARRRSSGTPSPKVDSATQSMMYTSQNTAEPNQNQSWSEWAWSWMPAWSDRQPGIEESPPPPAPLPMHFALYLDEIGLIFKIMETEGSNRKRPRGILEMKASRFAAKCVVCVPTTLRFRCGLRRLELSSNGKCVCGHMEYNSVHDLPTVYLRKAELSEQGEEHWQWPDDQLDADLDVARIVTEAFDDSEADPSPQTEDPTEPKEAKETKEEPTATSTTSAAPAPAPAPAPPETPEPAPTTPEPPPKPGDDFWSKMSPLLSVEYNHDRTPPKAYISPYDNPPKEFEFSDWVEDFNLKVQVQPMEIMISMGLLHRLESLRNVIKEVPRAPEQEPTLRTLTVEECEALLDNLPQRHAAIEIAGARLRIMPWNHVKDRVTPKPPCVLEVELMKASVLVTMPLYADRVCSAACQMPEMSGPLWQGARVHVSASCSLAVGISASGAPARKCGRAEFRILTHRVAKPAYFTRRSAVLTSLTVKLYEANICGSMARLQAAYEVASSLLNERISLYFKHTSLSKDALNDEELVALDMTIEDLSFRAYLARNIFAYICTLRAIKATALHKPKDGELKQAWLCSAPDNPTTTPFLRIALQWCDEPMPDTLDYLGVWTEPCVACVDPLLIVWLSYSPALRPMSEMQSQLLKNASSQYYRHHTLSSSNPRGLGRSSGSGTHVHMRPRSQDSSEPSEKPTVEKQVQTVENWWSGEHLLQVYNRLRQLLLNVEIGLVDVYTCSDSASAVDCETVRGAMERHANKGLRVFALSLGKIMLNSSSSKKELWFVIRHDGPTFLLKAEHQQRAEEDSFPWKMRVTEMSCYTLELSKMRESSGTSRKSQLKANPTVLPKTVLESVTTTVTISVVTKTATRKTKYKKPPEKKHHDVPTEDEMKMKYFTSGIDFKPTSLKEFVRGPLRRKKKDSIPQEAKPETKSDPEDDEYRQAAGPVVSLGFNVHADTPPIMIRLDHDQVGTVADAIHCMKHVQMFLRRGPLVLPKYAFTSFGSSHRSLVRSVSQTEEQRNHSEDTVSESKSELISIFEPKANTPNELPPLKTFFWFQWVISRVTVVVATRDVKLTFEIDDIISTIDLQAHYNQLKVKIASAAIKHYELSNTEWAPGVLGGRILEAREPAHAQEDNHFMAVTITQALISNLPASWKEELHPKLLESKNISDSMWEIYVTLAPLEAVLEQQVLLNIVSVMDEMAPQTACPLDVDTPHTAFNWQWPFCYVTAGGLRLLLTSEMDDENVDDTFIITLGKLSVNPHPENPICRRAVNAGIESAWSCGANGALEGRQYEITARAVSIKSSCFSQLVNEEESEHEVYRGMVTENPALKWTQQSSHPSLAPILHEVDLGCVLAPAMYVNDALAAGPAIEFNLVSDCSIEVSIAQIGLATRMIDETSYCLHTVDKIPESSRESSCPYAQYMASDTVVSELSISLEDIPKNLSEIRNPMEAPRTPSELYRSANEFQYHEAGPSTADSGIDTATSRSTLKYKGSDEGGLKKTVSLAFYENTGRSSDYLEVFVTMGTIDFALYCADDDSPRVVSLRPPKLDVSSRAAAHDDTRANSQDAGVAKAPASVADVTAKASLIDDEAKSAATGSHESSRLKDDMKTRRASHPLKHAESKKSLTETVRNVDVGKTKLERPVLISQTTKNEGLISLIHVTVHQPNLYYYRRKLQKILQISLYNLWIGLGASQNAIGMWHASLLSTARGVPDPVTDISPALATMKLTTAPAGGSAIRGSLCLDVERPLLLEVCADKLTRLKTIRELLNETIEENLEAEYRAVRKPPFLYNLRQFLVKNSIERVTIQTGQVGVCGPEGTFGWDASSLQLGTAPRPERLVGRALLTALLGAMGRAHDRRHPLLLPAALGMDLEATWDPWHKTDSGAMAKRPSVRICLDIDRISLDVRPADLASFMRLRDLIVELRKAHKDDESSADSTLTSTESKAEVAEEPPPEEEDHVDEDHYYKDDLRSGAFKIVTTGTLPMAYQVLLQGDSVSWRYPYSRAITRLIAYPMPGLNEETDCVLEWFSTALSRWEAHTYFKFPVGEPLDLNLYNGPLDAVFALMWRFRVCVDKDKPPTPFEFNITKYMPVNDPLVVFDIQPEPDIPRPTTLTGQQMAGAARIDSCSVPRAYARTRLTARVASAAINVHCAPPAAPSQATSFDGYYVSRPMMRSHPMLALLTADTLLHFQTDSSIGQAGQFETWLEGDILACSTGAMLPLVERTRIKGAASLPVKGPSRFRLAGAALRASVHASRLRTLMALAKDWSDVTASVPGRGLTRLSHTDTENIKSRSETAASTVEELEGRVSLWVHNSCATALRVGQQGSDDVTPLGPNVSLAYRWRNSSAPKQLRFALAGPSANWHWSNSIPFLPGSSRVRLQDADATAEEGAGGAPSTGVFLYVDVREPGAKYAMRLSGRLQLANLLRQDLLYKVRTKCPTTGQWRIVIGSSELKAETLGLSVVCGSEWDMVLKVKFMSSDTGWSGDIPLKECPKENVPWLVKVPREGDPPYQAVWCRVTRARSDGRVLAAVWPLYTIHSRLPLDTDVLIHTDNSQSNPEPTEEGPVLTQAASGRGVSTHLLTAGTTRARHSLHFKYRHGLDSPVTAESVPLHYGVTDVSVFDKCAPVDRIEDVVDCVQTWLDQYGQNVESQWPYSIVSKHYWGEWKPALSQPKCDVTIRYQAVRAGGGCALQLQLSPAALLCNATPLALTLRAHDAAPLCRVGAGVALAPPTSLLTKPFFMSMELGRETFVSGQLSVLATEPGRYGAPPPGHVAVDRPADFAIHCNHKVALLTLYYEIIEGINVLGVSSTYVLINKLHDDVLVSAVAVPDLEEATEAELMTKNYKFVPPTKKTDAHGTMVCRFAMAGRWRGGDPSELRAYVCVALPDGERAGPAVPVRLAAAPPRRAVSLLDERRHSVPIVVAQLKHEGRWVVTIAKDPCPQFVVHNRTSKCLAIGQPTDPDPSQITVQAVRECQGVAWWCRVEAGSVGHYSTPEYSARHPLPAAPAPPPPVTLTVAVHPEEGEPVWSAPIAIADGEQLVQLSGSHTFKVRVRTHPHSSLVELKDVDERDISASDIRKRLIGTSKAEEVRTGSSPNEPSINLKQIYEQPKFVRPDGTEELATQEVSEEVPCVAGHVDSLASFEMLARGGDASAENYNDSVAASSLAENERFRCMFSSVSLQVAKNRDVNPLLAAHLDRVTVLVLQDNKKLRTAISVADLQIDNLQYDSGQFDFAVVASTRNEAPLSSPLPSIWNIFNETRAFATRQDTARALIYMCHDTWSVGGYKYTELTELDIRLGPLALYVEDAYITALAELARIAAPPLQRAPRRLAEAETSVLERPLRLRLLHLQPLQLTLTLHTAARMYIALDQSPLSLSAFKLRDMMTSTQRLSHALTVHYLSAAVLGAGWMVGGLELLGAPGALAARVGGASGGVKGVASAAAAGLLRSVSAWAGSVARNLDLLAGDEEHARRAAAARRRPPPSLLAGLMTGITNLAINMLGAVGGLAHHPVVSVAAGEASGAAALRRGLLGALTKPLSATADLLAYAGSGLLAQTGWDPAPTPRPLWRPSEASAAGWRRDRVRWTFRLNELSAWGGAGVLLEQRVLQLLLTHRYLVIAEADTERIVEMIDFKNCSLGPYQGHTIELMVTQRKPAKALERLQIEDEDEYQISAAAMARVARYTGSDTAGGSEARVLALLPSPGQSVSLYAQLHAAILHNSTSHFPLL